MTVVLRAMATQLGVADPRSARAWLLRLFVLPPEQARELPGWLKAAAMPLLVWCARPLGVESPWTLRNWLRALFLHRPPRAQDGDASRVYLVRALAAVFDGAAALGHAALAPLRGFERWLDRFDFSRADAHVMTMAGRFGRMPRLASAAVAIVTIALLAVCATTPLAPHEQLALFLLMWLSALVIRRMPGNVATLILVCFSLAASSRYIWWRLTSTIDLEPGFEWFFGMGLIAAECYTWLILVLGYVQNAWPLGRKPVSLPADTASWPTVDVFIPTYNEPLKVVRPTVLAALGMDWPAEKLRVYILDDGRRDEMRHFAEQSGARYMIRPDNAHAKAGNLNHALGKTDGELVVIFDCDHMPVRSFLQTTVGWFLKDPRCAMLQTPHHFFSPDPFERNLHTFRKIPNEGSLFYGLVQDGNDLWNATFFCGSCAVLRRGPLMEVGGIAVETVTEDAHTALKLHRRGWRTAYLKLTQAAGLATESLSGHIGQRIRWARGMAQIFRLDNPLFGRGLSLLQRLCYANAMLHFFHGLPRLVFLTAPLAYLYAELHVINAAATTLAVYVLPHLFQAGIANSRMQGRYRHSFWAEAYESVLAWYIAWPTTLALINPRAGSFNVTAKGGLVDRTYFDWRIALPYVVLATANLIGLVVGIVRLFWWNADEPGTVLMNLVWTTYNLIMLGAALGVAAETRQVRVAHRVPLRMPATLYLADGRAIACRTEDYSTQGLGLLLPPGVDVAPATPLAVGLHDGLHEHVFHAHAAQQRERQLGLQFATMDLAQERALIACTFGRADAWSGWSDTTPDDRPLTSLFEVLGFGANAYARVLGNGARLLRDMLPPLRFLFRPAAD
ncbi:MAG: UDP-forming cellulose synthase catalytic subunit [Sinimarinibacterium flocculans]|uniref:UDP-forming cellulose synthase catalytic subunit n=1 Tax=Sinimarinibacterium flocculans TaxID=985250 RepID=UPI003C581D27